MSWLDKLERKFGKYAINNLMLYIVVMHAIGFIFIHLDITSITRLQLIPQLFFAGEYWRIVTFIMIPPTTGIIFFAFVLYFYYIIGSYLESVWGTFKFNIYYFIGLLGTIVGALVFNYPVGSTTYLNLSLFFAFAKLNPEFSVRLYFILPIKIKYLAWVQWAFFVLTLIRGTNAIRLAILVSIINYFIFFGKYYITKQKAYSRKQSYKKKSQVQKSHFHKCYVCGRTENDDPDLEFRYCSKCSGSKEYCSEHLFTHDHK
ncbi:Der1-like family protein [Natranaerovirga hydrolytica]|uniref:Der1-like family protein n=1 Tax=Natranaerovirga hydrolytica TaxID=680378 RepID=A0A4R1MXJ1_9FIRM|nr:hypothetical protein [Natranaerovirga hydrolytica]TCK97825.1 Der1-like family protein [Natranaerovirga hydrolytica]